MTDDTHFDLSQGPPGVSRVETWLEGSYNPDSIHIDDECRKQSDREKGAAGLVYLPMLYEKIMEILDTYIDTSPENKHILALWCIGASFKDAFASYPELFVNASKGSGKSRLLNIITHIVVKAMQAASISESSLFRLPSQMKINCLCLDEAENLSGKQKAMLEELIRQAYKRGGQVYRTEGDSKSRHVVGYPIYMAVCMANIWGLNDVLQDRCITLILKKSTNEHITNIPEFFQFDKRFEQLAELFSVGSAVYVGVTSEVETLFNAMLTPTLDTHTTHSTQHTLLTYMRDIKFDGRSMELWSPLFVLSWLMGGPAELEKTIAIAKSMVKTKQEKDAVSDLDLTFALYLHDTIVPDQRYTTKELITGYTTGEKKADWCTPTWVGDCLIRLGATKLKGRLARGNWYTFDKEELKRYIQARGADIGIGQAELQAPAPQKLMATCELCRKNGVCVLNPAGHRVCYPMCNIEGVNHESNKNEP